MQLSKPLLIVILGPTASGKTALSIAMAHHFQTEVISADSRQIYREMRIGTARPEPKELNGIRHHLLGTQSIHHPITAGDFARQSLTILENIYRTKQTAILTGGTFLYVKALCEGLNEFPEVPEQIRKKVNAIHQKEGLEPLNRILKEKDPVYYATVDRSNPHRVMRAVSVILASDKPFSSYFEPMQYDPPFKPVYLVINISRETLYHQIDTRVESMMKNGLLEEAKALYPFRDLKPLHTVGYQELFAYFDGQCTLNEAVEKIKQHSRNYAKRQLTWLRNMENLHAVSPDFKDFNEVITW